MGFKSTMFWGKQCLRGGVKKKYKNLIDNQNLSLNELRQVNFEKRKKILKHAYENVPYYARTFREAGIHPDAILTEEDWSSLPVLTKEDVRENFSEFISNESAVENLRVVTTGGSTGIPLKVAHDSSYPQEVIGWRMLSWWGVDPSDDAAFCWRLIRKGYAAKFINKLMWWPTKRVWFDASSMSPKSALEFIDQFNTVKPRYFQGYTGSIDYLANVIKDEGLFIEPPACVWGTSSPISGIQRKNIEDAFCAPLYNQYGCSEVFWLAAECQYKKGLHVFHDVRNIDIVDDDYNADYSGSEGNLVITDLENYTFPLIRYLNGDRGRFLDEQCACGLPFPLMAPINGRISDLIRSPDGVVIGGDYITTLFDDFPGAVGAFQLRQYEDFSIKLFVVPSKNRPLSDVAVESVINNLFEHLGSSLNITSIYVEEIEADRGKTRYVISDIS